MWGKCGEIQDLGSGGRVWEAILIINFKKRGARKFCRMILLHVELVTFRSHFGKNRKPFMFMFFGLGGRVQDSQNQLCLILDKPNDSKNNQEIPALFKKSITFGNINLGTPKF